MHVKAKTTWKQKQAELKESKNVKKITKNKPL